MKKILAALFGLGIIGATLGLAMAKTTGQTTADCDWKKIRPVRLETVSGEEPKESTSRKVKWETEAASNL